MVNDNIIASFLFLSSKKMGANPDICQGRLQRQRYDLFIQLRTVSHTLQ